MNDLDYAKKLMFEEDLKLVLVKDGNILYRSSDRGIKPIYYIAKNLKEEARGASLSDRVIGRGAGIIVKYLEINKIYAELMSKTAMDILDNTGIEYFYREKTTYIENRNKTGLCPIEQMTEKIKDPIDLLNSIEEFLNTIQ